MWLGMAGERPHRFLHNNFRTVYRIFTKLGRMIPMWKEKSTIYFGVIRSKVKVTVTINRIFNRVVSVLYIGSLTNLATWFPCGRGRTLFILGSLPLYLLIIYIDGRILWCTHFLFRNKKKGILNIEQCTQGLITLVNNAQDIYFSVNFSNKTNLAI